MTRKHRYVRALSGALIAGLLIFFSYHQWRGEDTTAAGMGAPVVLVTTTPVVVEDAPISINVFGSLRALDSAIVASEINGIIAEIFFTEGASVEANAPLVRLDDVLEQAELAKASAQLELNTADYQRMESLLSKNAISKQEVDQAKATRDVSSAELEIAKAHVETALIKAPFAGVLGARKISAGQYITAGEPLLEIVDRAKLTLEYSVSERYLSEVKLGQTISLTTPAYPDETFTGTVNFISPSIDPSTRTLALEAVVDNTDNRLSPGASVRLTHVLGIQKDSLKIPEESIMPTVEGYRVYVIVDGIASSLPIEIGTRIKGYVYISHGLKAGDEVVTRGQEKLRDGAQVEILKEGE